MNAAASEIGAPVVPPGSAVPQSAQTPNDVSPTQMKMLPEEDSKLPLLGLLLGTTAASWYLSALLHLVGYVAAAIAFVLFGHHLIELETETTPIRASLDDFDREDDHPDFEATAEITIGDASGESDVQQLTDTLKAYENGMIETLASEALPSYLKSEDDNTTGASEGFLLRVPEAGFAVTKGSFTAWTIPERPRPRSEYEIVIQLRLPDGVKAYRVSDLRGKVVGTDSYTQRLPYDPKKPHNTFCIGDEGKSRITGQEVIKVQDNRIQLVIRVPGAEELIQDTIEISSRRLREKQKLELVFGGR